MPHNPLKKLADRVFFKGLTLQERMQLTRHINATFNSESGKITLRYLLYVSGITDYDKVLMNEKALLVQAGMQRITKTCLKHATDNVEALLSEIKEKASKESHPSEYDYTGLDKTETIE